MKRLITTFITLALAAGLPAIGHAQAGTEDGGSEKRSLDFNRSPAAAMRILEDRGFSQMKVLDIDQLAAQLEACRDNEQFHFLLRLDGRILHLQRIDECRA